MRRFKLLETCKWQEGLSHGPHGGKHSLGPIYWGVKINDGSNPYICALQRVYKPQYVDQILEVVSAEHNISVNECLEYIPGLIQDISRYYKDQLIIDPNSEELITSREDEQIRSFYVENLAEIVENKSKSDCNCPYPGKKGTPRKCLRVYTFPNGVSCHK